MNNHLPATERNANAVAITGIGVTSPLGRDVGSFKDALLGCRSCLETLSIFDAGLDPKPVVAQVRESLDVDDRPGFRLSRTDRLAVLASRDALADAFPDGHGLAEGGIVVATTVAGLSEVDHQAATDPRGYYRKLGLLSASSYQHGHVADVMSSYFGLQGPRLTVSVACASGSMAIAIAARMILEGNVPFVLAGGSEALCRFTISGFNALQALDPEPCRPFDRSRSGLNIGEGAAMLVLESLRRARERKAHVWALVRGWGMTNDAFHPTAPAEDGHGLAESMLLSMKMAGVGPDEIGYVNAHGTGTYLNDIAEAKAYEEAFRGRSRPIPVSSSKSYFGHNLGAAGALEAVVTVLSLRSGFLFPTLRLRDPIESTSIDWLMGEPRCESISMAISASAGFGGSNTSLLLGVGE